DNTTVGRLCSINSPTAAPHSSGEYSASCSWTSRNRRVMPNSASAASIWAKSKWEPSTSAAGSAPVLTTTALMASSPANEAAIVSASFDVAAMPSGPASTITRNISQHLQFLEHVDNGRCRLGTVAQYDGLWAEIFGHLQLGQTQSARGRAGKILHDFGLALLHPVGDARIEGQVQASAYRQRRCEVELEILRAGGAVARGHNAAGGFIDVHMIIPADHWQPELGGHAD